MPDRPTGPPLERPQRREPGFATGGDRKSLELSKADQALIKAAAEANPRTIVVMMGGSAILVEGWHDAVAAIVMLWYPGMEGGRALADVLLGRANPSGRLPFVVPTNASHLPFFDREATSITYDLFHGQWMLDGDKHAPRYPFGFGLSYSSTAVTDVTAAAGADAIAIHAAVMNEGDRDASEVVQVYAGARDSKLERPMWRLAAFQRVDVPAHGSEDFGLSVPFNRLAVRVNGEWIVEPGGYDVAVGRYAHDPKATVVRVDLPLG